MAHKGDIPAGLSPGPSREKEILFCLLAGRPREINILCCLLATGPAKTALSCLLAAGRASIGAGQDFILAKSPAGRKFPASECWQAEQIMQSSECWQAEQIMQSSHASRISELQ